MVNKVFLTFLILCCTASLIRAASYDNFSPPKLGNSPSISEIRKPVPHDRPIRVAVTCIVPGSACKNQFDLAKGLSKAVDKDGKPMYDVTVIAPMDKEIKESDTLHKFALPYGLEETDLMKAAHLPPNKMFPQIAKFNRLILQLFDKDFDTLEKLREQEFDFYIGVQLMPYE